GEGRRVGALGVAYASALAVGLGLAEFVGGVFLILGIATLWVSLALLADMALTVWKVHYPHGLTLKGGILPGGGHTGELHLVLIGGLLCLLLGGPGAVSIDQRRSRHAEVQAPGRARMRKA